MRYDKSCSICDDFVCKICGSKSHPKHSKSFDEKLVKYYECIRCHFLQAEHFDISNIYNEYLDNNDFGWKERNRKIVKIVDYIVKIPAFTGVDKKSKIMDFGCGQGYLVSELRQLGLCAFGYDQFLNKKQKDMKYLYSDMSGLCGMKFGLITCIEVLEHLWHPVKDLELLCRVLSDKGFLLISTCMYNPEKHNSDWWYLGPEAGHVSIFSRQAMDIFLRRLDLHIVFQISDAICLVRKNSHFRSRSLDFFLRNISNVILSCRKLQKGKLHSPCFP